MGNYYLYENMHPILVIAKKKHEIWIVYFDRARCKYGCGAGVVFKSPKGYIRRFSFRFTWICTNNAHEYEVLCLGLYK